MNEFKKQLMAKIGDMTEQKSRVIKRVNDALDSKPRKGFAWGYYVTFATFVGIFVLGLIVLPNLLNEQASLTEENPTVIDPITEPTEENGYYEELKQFFPPDGTVATYDVVSFYSEGSIVTTKWLSDRYVLQISKGINCPECIKEGSISIYRITDDSIELISPDGDYRTDWTIEELDKLPPLSVILKAPIKVGTEFNGLKITTTEEKVTTKYGEFSNAILVEEIEGYERDIADYNVVQYYVPGYGLVKSDITSLNSGSTELVSIEFGNEVIETAEYTDELISYFFPERNLQYNFIGGFEGMGSTVHTYWLSEQYVQQLVGHKDFGIAEQIYRINGNEIELIYSSNQTTFKPTTWTTEQLDGLSKIQTELRAPFNIGDEYITSSGQRWTITETNGTVNTTAYGEINNVLILENINEEQLIRSRRYLAKGFGEVKYELEFVNEENGRYEVTLTSELASKSQIMFELEQNEQSIFGVYEANQYDFTAIDSEWELSPDGTKRATLVGRAKDFEGINVLVIEDLATKKFTIYKLKDESIQNTPKDLEWIDTKRLYVIVGYGFGTVTRGGSLYELELESHSTTPIVEYDASTSKEEIMSITSNGDGTFTYEKHIYQDDELNYGYVEENIISPTE